MVARWTKEEIDFIISNYVNHDCKYIAEKLDRTIDAVRAKIKEKRKEQIIPRKKAQDWSEDEILFLKQNYALMGYKELEKNLNRPINGIKDKALCLKLKKRICHYQSSSRLYGIWARMRSRCYYKNNQDYKYYGARGIIVCKEWSDSAPTFIEWAIQNGYEEHLTIDRIDNNGNYCPENCRWATTIQQQNNKSSNIRLEAFGETKTLMEWSRDPRCVVGYEAIRERFKKGYCGEDIVAGKPNSLKKIQ